MNLSELDKVAQRIRFRGLIGDNENGAFDVGRGPCGAPLHVIASTGEGWEHVSVSTPHRCPNWIEMEWVKKRTMGDVVAFQLHLPATDHISVHPYCLHIWRPLAADIPMPPKWMVA
jgi:hypothetical protein